jgi:hypothetical protein
MNQRIFVPLTVLTGIAAAVLLATLPAIGQGTVPRTADGHPDLSGIWTNATITPLERPKDLAGKEFFTEQEAIAYEKNSRERRNKDVRQRGTITDVANAYNDFWWDSGSTVVKTRRTSLIVDPPDGKLPALTPGRRDELQTELDAKRQRCQHNPGCEPDNGNALAPADGPEDRPLMERCLSFNNVTPMLPTAYNNDYEIVQTPGAVAIDVEMVHQVRHIPLDGSPHLPANIRTWMGDSRGHWEGDTLVIDTTNFNDQVSYRGSDKNLHMIERLTRTDPDTLVYRFTMDDPTAFTKPWTAELPMVKAKGLLYEYACHEGNMGMTDILSSARSDEKKAESASKH